MKKIVMYLLIAFITTIILKAEQEIYGEEGISGGIGFTFIGPSCSMGHVISDESYIELYYIWHTIDWEKNEKLINKPTSGGHQAGLNYFPKFLGKAKYKKAKLFCGVGYGFLDERSGEETSYDYKGYWKYYEAHGGLRYYISKKMFISCFLGYMFSINDKNTIWKKYLIGYEIEEKLSPLSASIGIWHSL